MIRLFRRHPVSEEDLSSYIDGELAVYRRPAVEGHVFACVRCSTRLSELRSLKSLLASLPPVGVPRSFTLTPAQAGHTAAARSTWRTPLVLAPALTLAALVILLGVDLAAFPGAASRPEAAAPQQKALSSDRASEAAGALPPAQPTIAPPAAASRPSFAEPQPGQTPAVQAAPLAPAAPGASPGSPPRAGPAVTASPTQENASARHDTLRAAAYVLTVLAALGFVGSLGFVVWKRRARAS